MSMIHFSLDENFRFSNPLKIFLHFCHQHTPIFHPSNALHPLCGWEVFHCTHQKHQQKLLPRRSHYSASHLSFRNGKRKDFFDKNRRQFRPFPHIIVIIYSNQPRGKHEDIRIRFIIRLMTVWKMIFQNWICRGGSFHVLLVSQHSALCHL